MLDKIRGKPKVDPALEEVRRKTAARLAAIVGLTEEAELDTELDPGLPAAAHGALDEPESGGHQEPGPAAAPVLVLAGPATTTVHPDEVEAEGSVEPTVEPEVADVPGVAATAQRSDRDPVDDDGWDDLPLGRRPDPAGLPSPDPSGGQPVVALAPVVAFAPIVARAPVALPANAVGVMDVAAADAPQAVGVLAGVGGVALRDEAPPALQPARPQRRTSVAAANAPAKESTTARPDAPAKGPANAPASSGRPAAPAKERPSAPSRTPTDAPARAPATANAPARSAAHAKAAAPVTVPRSAATAAEPQPKAAKASRPKRATPATAAARGRTRSKAPKTDLPAACPTCGRLLEEVPAASRRCLGCRQRIVPKRIDGRIVLLAEAVIPLFEAERRRLVDGGRLARECGQWLRLAALVGAPEDVLEARARAVAARPTREAVTAARALYASTVERTCRAARRSKDWRTVADLRFRQSRAYHRAAGAPIPPEPAVVLLHREAIDAALRAIAEISREAQLAGGVCCEACSAQSGQVVKIPAERKASSLPHADCPVGLCGCRWEVPERRRAAVTQLARRRAQAASPVPRKVKSTAG